MPVTDLAALVAAANADPEFVLAARYWNATLTLQEPERAWRVEIANGRVAGCREVAASESATARSCSPGRTAS